MQTTGMESDQHHAGTAGAARIALGGVHGGLFVTDQDMAQARLGIQRVVHRQDGAARVAKDGVHATVDQCLQHPLRARQLAHVAGVGSHSTERSFARFIHRSTLQIKCEFIQYDT